MKRAPTGAGTDTTMASYAAKTKVATGNSREEIERTLLRYGADNFGYLTGQDQATIVFTAHSRQIRFVLPLPDRNSREFTHTPERGTPRSKTAAADSYDQAVRQRWRALLLIVKAKLEAVQSGLMEFEQEFLPYTVLADGATVFESTREAIETQYNTGQATTLLAITS